jgi:cytochrome c oxidase subunit IV
MLLPAAVFLIYLFENSIIYLKSGMITALLGEMGMAKTAVIYAVITFAEICGILFFTINKASSIKTH